jgi:hypothetical protein
MKLWVSSLCLGACVTVVAATAAAQYDDVRQRAACAQVEMAEALGDPVSPEEKRQCQAVPKKPPAPRPPKDAKGETVFKDMPQLKELPAEKACGAWIRGMAAQGEVLYGVGIVQKGEAPEAKATLIGMQRAMMEIAAQISVQINGSVYSDQVEHTAQQTKNGITKTTQTSFSALSDTSRMVVGSSLEDARLEDSCHDAKGTLYVLMSLDMAKVAEKQAAIVQAVIQALTDATLRAADALATDQFTQELLIEVLDTLEGANAMGRTKLGRKVKDQWAKEYDGLLRLAKRMTQCLEVEGGYAPGDNQTVLFKASCNAKAIRNGKFTYEIAGGMMDLPDVLTTGDKGVGKVKVGETYGSQTIKVTLAHDVGASKGAYLVKSVPKNQNARFEIEATAKPTAFIKVQGIELTAYGENGLAAAVEAWISRRWGAQVVDSSSAKLKVNVIINVNPGSQVYGNVVVPVDLTITVIGPRGPMFDKTGRHAGQARTEREARTQAFVNIVRSLKSW